jgi:hypothetical protein
MTSVKNSKSKTASVSVKAKSVKKSVSVVGLLIVPLEIEKKIVSII